MLLYIILDEGDEKKEISRRFLIAIEDDMTISGLLDKISTQIKSLYKESMNIERLQTEDGYDVGIENWQNVNLAFKDKDKIICICEKKTLARNDSPCNMKYIKGKTEGTESITEITDCPIKKEDPRPINDVKKIEQEQQDNIKENESNLPVENESRGEILISPNTSTDQGNLSSNTQEDTKKIADESPSDSNDNEDSDTYSTSSDESGEGLSQLSTIPTLKQVRSNTHIAPKHNSLFIKKRSS